MRYTCIAALAGASLFTALPIKASTFDYVQVSLLEQDAYDLKLDGPQLDVSKTLGERYFVGGGYGEFSSEVQGFDVDSELLYVRAGF